MTKAVIAGTGFIARTHAAVLRELGIQTILAVSSDQREAEEFAAEFGIPHASDDFNEIFSYKPDCVHICTPPSFHIEELRSLISHGIHVFCEKPLCFSLEEAAEITRLAEEKGVLHGMDFNVRYHAGIQQIRQRFLKGDPGRLYLVHGTYLQEFHVMPCPFGWRYQSEYAGKMRAVTEIGSHWMDLFEYVSGERIKEVNAVFANVNPERTVKEGMLVPSGENDEILKVDTEDAAMIHFRTEKGTIGSIVLSEISAGRVNYLSLEFCGEKQTIRWNSEEPNTVYTGILHNGTNVMTYPFEGGFADTQRKLFKAFYDDLASGGKEKIKSYPTLIDGYRNTMLCDAVYRSAMSGQWQKTEEEE